jgi:hypothetical protein
MLSGVVCVADGRCQSIYCSGWYGASNGERLGCVLYDVEGLCVMKDHVKEDIRFGGHSFIQLVVCSGFSMDVEIFYYI